ncbi:MAG: hypothetical protein ACN4GT_00160 [Gammaproteobacteria bacterium]
MIKSNERSLAARLRTALLALLLSFAIVPVFAFIGGSIVVGEYEGSSGLLGYLMAIYGDALKGRWLAWLLILSPVLIIGCWTLILKLLRYSKQTPTPAAESS